jgi:hypothetical protein
MFVGTAKTRVINSQLTGRSERRWLRAITPLFLSGKKIPKIGAAVRAVDDRRRSFAGGTRPVHVPTNDFSLEPGMTTVAALDLCTGSFLTAFGAFHRTAHADNGANYRQRDDADNENEKTHAPPAFNCRTD